MTSPDSEAAAGAFPARMPRKNLMLAASIEAGGARAAVRIRNLSESGAMLDGAVLPEPGSQFILLRADIAVPASVVWREGGRCGVRFDKIAATVDEWVAGKTAPTFNGQQGQARVDAIQNAVRSGAALPSEAKPSGETLPAGEIERRVSEEIVYVQRLIDALGEELVEDPVMLQRHMRVLQNLDRASQMLEHLGTVLGASDRLAAAQGVVMQDLRERLLRKPNF